ncbi:MAG: hypothetical protein IJ751_09780 [Oscillospiraceae bacterium]|nr:hypothetical protein [Oscillospiraceae bacterium]
MGGLALLICAVLLMTRRGVGARRTPLWEAHFPGLSFPAAILIVGAELILCAGVVNYIVF